MHWWKSPRGSWFNLEQATAMFPDDKEIWSSDAGDPADLDDDEVEALEAYLTELTKGQGSPAEARLRAMLREIGEKARQV